MMLASGRTGLADLAVSTAIVPCSRGEVNLTEARSAELESGGKLTVPLHTADTEKLDEITKGANVALGNRVGKKIHKTDVVRAMIRLLDRDAYLRRLLLEQLERSFTE